MTGWPITTISRGEVIFADGQISAERGRGRLPNRGKMMPV